MNILNSYRRGARGHSATSPRATTALPRVRSSLLLSAAVAGVLAPLHTQAASKTWDGGGANNNWSATPINWDLDVAPLANDDLFFDGVTRLSPSNDFATNTNFNSLTFNSGAGAFTLSGNAITLGGNVTNLSANTETINLGLVLSATRTFTTSAGNIAVGGVISGSTFGITKTGSGIASLSGTNTFTGVTTIQGGTLSVSSILNGGVTSAAGQASATAANLVLNGGTLQYVGSSTDGTTDRLLTLGANGGTIDGSGTGQLIFNGGGPIEFAGGTGARTLTLTGTATGSLDSSFALDVVDNTGATSLTKSGSGTWNIGSTSNTYSGDTTISGGTLKLGNSSVIPNGGGKGNVVLSGTSTFDLNGGTTEIINGLTGSSGTFVTNGLSGTATLTVGDADASSTFAGTLQNAGTLKLTKIGTGTLTLSNSANTYTGATTVNGGVLSVAKIVNGGASSGIGASTNVAANLVLNGGTLQFTGTVSGSGATDRLFTLTTNGGTLDSSGTQRLTLSNTGAMALSGTGTRTLTLTGTNDNVGALVTQVTELAAQITDNGANATSLRKTGTGRWYVSNASNSFTGDVSIENGRITLVTNATPIANIGTASQIGKGSSSTTSLSLGATGTTGFLRVGQNASFSTNRKISIGGTGGGGIEMAISGQTLTFTGGVALGASGGGITFGNFTDIMAGNYAVTTNGISGSGGVTMAGGGSSSILTLSGTNTYSGATTVNGGTLKLGASSVIPNGVGKGNAVLSGTSTFDLNGNTTETINGLTGSSGTFVTNGLSSTTATLTVGDADASSTFAGTLQNTGTLNLTKIGTGTLTLSNSANSYAGVTQITAGTIAVAKLANVNTDSSIGKGSVAGSAADLVLNGGTLQYTGSGDSSNRLFTLTANGGTLDASGALNAAINLNGTGALVASGAGNRTLTLRGSSTGANTLAGALPNPSSGTTALTKSDAGKWILSASNTYTGGTSVAGGTLAVSNASALSTGNVSVTGGTLDLGNGSVLGVSVGAGAYSQGSSGTTRTTFATSNIASASSLTASSYAFAGTLDIAGGAGISTSNTASATVFNAGSRSGRFNGFNYGAAYGPGQSKAWDTSRVDRSGTGAGTVKVITFYEGFEDANGVTWAGGSAIDQFDNVTSSYVFNSANNVPNPPYTSGSPTLNNVSRVVNASAASANASYGVATPADNSIYFGNIAPFTAHVGPSTDFGGYRNSFGTGFTAQADIYLDPNWTGTSNGTGFDYSVAVSDTSGNHRRDFIFHVFKDGSGNLRVGANSNSNYKAASTLSGSAVITGGAGWYTLQHVFRAGDGNLENASQLYVDLNLLDASGSVVYTANLSNTTDLLTGVGGNNYGWLVNVDTIDTATSVNSLRVDNVKLLDTAISGGGLGGGGAGTSLTGIEGNVTLSGGLASFDVGGTNQAAVVNGYDFVQSSRGTLTTAGTLDIDLVNGFVPLPTDTFTILEAQTLSGTFTNISSGRVLVDGGAGSFALSRAGNRLTLSNFIAIAIPEPSSTILLGVGAMALGRRRRNVV